MNKMFDFSKFAWDASLDRAESVGKEFADKNTGGKLPAKAKDAEEQPRDKNGQFAAQAGAVAKHHRERQTRHEDIAANYRGRGLHGVAAEYQKGSNLHGKAAEHAESAKRHFIAGNSERGHSYLDAAEEHGHRAEEYERNHRL